MVGLPGFEPGSIAPKATSIDQTNPQALLQGAYPAIKNFAGARPKYPDRSLTAPLPSQLGQLVAQRLVRQSLVWKAQIVGR